MSYFNFKSRSERWIPFAEISCGSDIFIASIFIDARTWNTFENFLHNYPEFSAIMLEPFGEQIVFHINLTFEVPSSALLLNNEINAAVSLLIDTT